MHAFSPEEGQTTFFLNPLKFRILYLFVGVHLFFAIALGQIYAFAPDEGGYLAIFRNTYKWGFSTASITGWSNSPTLFLRLLYAPAKILTLVGVEDLLAIRILAIITSTTSVYLMICTARFLRKDSARLPLTLIVVLFIPSTFLWMSLGLRESFIFLALSMICSGIALVSAGRNRSGFLLFLFGGLTLCYTKSYLYVLAFFSLLLLFLLRVSMQRRFRAINGLLLVVFVIPLVISPPTANYVIGGILSQVRVPGFTLSGPSLSVDEKGLTQSVMTTEVCSHPSSLFSKIMKRSGSSCEATPVCQKW